MSKNEGSEKSKEPTDVENNWLDSEDINKKRLRVLASINGGWRVSSVQCMSVVFICLEVHNTSTIYILQLVHDCFQVTRQKYSDSMLFAGTRLPGL